MSVFDLYAAYYDLLYGDKNYAAETTYITELVSEVRPNLRSILEFGCGTGGHAQEIVARGIRVCGVDRSQGMIDGALDRKRSLRPEMSALLEFQTGDVRDYRSNRSFDAIMSLFHVLSYQTSNADQDATLATARAHLSDGGVFAFDFWYGPAVLSDPPRHSVKEVANDKILVRRKSTPRMLVNENCVNVHFDIEIVSKADGRTTRLAEDHLMRYLFIPELRQRSEAAGFELLTAHEWMSRKPLSQSSWYGCAIAKAR